MTDKPSSSRHASHPRPSEQQAREDADLLRALRLDVFDQLAAYLIHELSQPLSVTRITTENVLHDLNSDRVATDMLRERLNTIRDQSERLAGTVERLMHLGNRQAGASARFDICKTLDEMAATLRHAAVMCGLSFEVSSPDGPTHVTGSPRNLWLVLVGLLTMRWNPNDGRRGGATTPGSGILIHAERRKTTVALDLIHDGCEATGRPGGAAADPADDIRLRAARRVIERMDGQFDIAIRDTGIHVRIVLPLADKARTEAAAETPKPASVGSATRPLSILLVDDEVLALEGIQEYLSRRGHTVVTASNGKEALRQFAVTPVDVVVTDLRMPLMDGNTLIREIRRESQLPIIAMTGHAGPIDEEMALSDGASIVLHKPVRLRDLSNALDKVTAAA